MEYEDRLRISTPEGVDLELPLAGLGSRFIAALIDWTIKGTLVLGVVIALGVALDGSDTSTGIAIAVASVLIFLILWFYDVAFEVMRAGRTPGKQMTGLRVVREGGAPVDLRASAVRNLLRLVDGLPLSYVPAVISILVTKRNQRLGDLAAGTLVVRDQPHAVLLRPPPLHPVVRGPAAPDLEAATWDLSAITQEELATVRRFLERRFSLVPEARMRLASDLARRLRPKVAGVGGDVGDEAFLERLSAAKAARA